MQTETSHGRSPLRNRFKNDSIRWCLEFETVGPWHSGGPTIALRGANWKTALETSCCICRRSCLCLIRQCPCVRFRLSKIQIHNLTRWKIDEFFMKMDSGFRGNSSFPIGLDFWRFLFWVKYKTFFECSLILFRCLLPRVLFYIVQFLDSPTIPLFRIAIF